MGVKIEIQGWNGNGREFHSPPHIELHEEEEEEEVACYYNHWTSLLYVHSRLPRGAALRVKIASAGVNRPPWRTAGVMSRTPCFSNIAKA
jgi:hypothetical protein